MIRKMMMMMMMMVITMLDTVCFCRCRWRTVRVTMVTVPVNTACARVSRPVQYIPVHASAILEENKADEEVDEKNAEEVDDDFAAFECVVEVEIDSDDAVCGCRHDTSDTERITYSSMT
mmetsp:Transcript_42703/g.47734  ORF Transcript_42703/g.47734 Transcript_42703/m.47734 type:complete len:119 (+) Transcript_42703:756-1112(+)